MGFMLNSFYCSKCGNKTIELPRKKGHQHKSLHIKTLYCPHCRIETQNVECKNDEDVFIFKQKFENGEYLNG